MPNNRKPKKSQAVDPEALKRAKAKKRRDLDRAVLRFAAMGYSGDALADVVSSAIGYSVSRGPIERSVERVFREVKVADVETLRRREYAHLDAITGALAPGLTAGDPTVRQGTAGRLVQVSAARRKLLGLDAPELTETTVSVDTAHLSAAALFGVGS